jgi:hypothetical protein
MPSIYPENLTKKNLQKLVSMSPYEHVTLWTLQHRDAFKELKIKDYLTGSYKFAFPSNESHPQNKKSAYDWMQSQMRVRLGICCELPIWASPNKPSHTTRKGDLLLRIKVPKRRVLFSFYELWCWRLRIDSSDPYHPSIPNDYFSTDESEKSTIRACNTRPTDSACRKSWEKMFDLELALRDDLLWQPLNMQATLPKIWRREVKEVLPIQYVAEPA